VKICLEGAGFRVVDLGTDVHPESFAQACRENKADLVGISALLSSTMLNIEHAIKAVRKENPRSESCGGAPVTEEYARRLGADAYAPDAYLAAKSQRTPREKLNILWDADERRFQDSNGRCLMSS